jgi:hypothetical protein
MTTKKRNKILYWVFKVLAIFVSCIFPIWAVLEKFPVWETSYGAERSVGAGAIIILTVLVVVFRKTVFEFITEKFNIKHAPPMVVWLVLLIISYVLIYLGEFLRDLTTVLWMGLLGCAIGTAFTFVAENYFKEKESNDDISVIANLFRKKEDEDVRNE